MADFVYRFDRVMLYLQIGSSTFGISPAGNRINLQNDTSEIAYKIEKVNLRREIFNDF
jgi:hypothetical protein